MLQAVNILSCFRQPVTKLWQHVPATGLINAQNLVSQLHSSAACMNSPASRGKVEPASTTTGPQPSNPGTSASAFSSWLKDIRAIPMVPWQLGVAGVIPFLALTPPVAKKLHSMFIFIPPELVANAATYQVGYGACILSFLGAVHWGAAMSSTLTGPAAHAQNNERYIWGVMPSLLAWPLLMMDPGPASLALSVMLAFVYYQDKRMGQRGMLPHWYGTLRGPLTLMAALGTSTTAAYYIHLTMEQVANENKQS